MVVRLAGVSAFLIALTAVGPASAQWRDGAVIVHVGEALHVSYGEYDPYVNVFPRVGLRGSTVVVVAGGLDPYQRVQLGVSDGTFGFTRMARTRADALGRVTAELVVPRDRDRDGRMRFLVVNFAGRVLARSPYFEVAVDPIWRGGPAAIRRYY